MKQSSNKNIVFVATADFLKPLSTLIESFIRYTNDDINFFLVTDSNSMLKQSYFIEKAKKNDRCAQYCLTQREFHFDYRKLDRGYPTLKIFRYYPKNVFKISFPFCKAVSNRHA